MPKRLAVVAVLLGLLTAGCGTAGYPTRATTSTPVPAVDVATPREPTLVLDAATPAELSLATSRALFDRAPVVALAGETDHAGQRAAAELADAGVPLLLLPDRTAERTRLTDELRRLDPVAVVPYGAAAERFAAEYAETGDAAVHPPGAPLPEVRVPTRPTSLLVLSRGTDADRAASHTARASGARVVTVSDPDPRADPAAIAALAGQPVGQILALGGEFGPAPRLRHRVEVTATGAQLPGGGAVVLPGRRLVALYGHPGDPNLGVLGEQPLAETITRARETAARYQELFDEPVVPTFEIITTVASSQPGPAGDYSLRTPVEQVRPWVDAAEAAGIYVVLDLQPGRTDFLTQARQYEELLARPHVGLALDPEWRLAPHQVHLAQIGRVDAAEVNQVADWLAELTRRHRLPQKLLVLHQFQLAMIGDRERLATHHDELAVLIHADGHGTPAQKQDTWRALQTGAPDRIFWGWKNFYDEDRPMLTPAETAAVRPTPWFISYQ